MADGQTNADEFEVIDLSDPYKKCSAVPSPYLKTTRVGLFGYTDAVGTPWICGGTIKSPTFNGTFNGCEAFIQKNWKQLERLVQSRAFAGQSLIASDRYLITGGLGNDQQPLATIEEKTERGPRAVESNIPETLYQHCQVFPRTFDSYLGLTNPGSIPKNTFYSLFSASDFHQTAKIIALQSTLATRLL